MMRDPKTGKFERITGDAKQIDKALKSKNACWIYTKDPSIEGAEGGLLVIRWQRDND